MMYFLNTLQSQNAPLFYFGLVCLILAIICLLLMKVRPITVLGISAWMKPFKFFISTTIFVWSMAWFMRYLDHPVQVMWYSWSLIVLFTIEDVYIFIQSILGQPSHFNISTPFRARMWVVMAFAAVMISITTAAIGTYFFSEDFPSLPESYLWSIRMGLIVFVIFSMEGIAMGGRMAHSVGGKDGGPGLPAVNWSTTHGDLRVAHFLGMHGLQVLPLLSFYLLKDSAVMIIVSIIYALIVLGVFAQALNGRPFIKGASRPTS